MMAAQLNQHPRRNGEIDSLRCFAMLAVIGIHCSLMPFGWLGVWLFFVISGYVVTGAMRPVEAGPGAWLRDFYTRRAVRIVPVYGLYLAIGVAVVVGMGGVVPLIPIASLLLFVNNFAMIAGEGEIQGWSVGHLWTISVEMQFYAVFGIVYVFSSRRTLTFTLLSFVLIAPVLRGLAGHFLPAILPDGEAVAYTIYATSFLHFDAFAAGALLFLLGDEIRQRKLEPIIFLAGLLAVLLYAAAYILVNATILHQVGVDALRNILSGILAGQGREIWLYSAIALLNAGVLVWTAHGTAPWSILTRQRFFQRIGEISYGGYIFHAIAIFCINRLLGYQTMKGAPVSARIIVFVLASAVAIGAAWISFEAFESKVSRRFSPKRRLALH